ncbi:MAG: YggT family protein [Dehalococcoidia bacterium]|nr:YggT family protein [Dehalococcoidia bacterium]
MNDSVAALFTVLIYAIILLVLARSLLSWFPLRPGNPVARFLYQATEPLLAPVRNILPRTGMVDLSAMVVLLFLYIMLMVIDRAASG